ncbi:MAG: single-stranded-DNA-specific exonuclease RecJ [Bacteroidetes bacterium]|nr:single-stranded-DNA-specific exonuclease RecJ [Bacteroidota bacterium]
MTPVREYRWSVRTETEVLSPEAAEAVKVLSEQLGISPILTEILVSRGIDTFEKARLYFRPQLQDLHDPFKFRDMASAVERIELALRRRERILVYGDYDVDGTDGTAMLWSFLTKLGADVHYFVPDRIRDGYGLSTQGIEQVKTYAPSLLIAVDCGITAVDQVDDARTLGIDVIICDHHEPSERIPNAVAVLDPLRPECPYEFKYLCGCGVAFKLIQGLLQSPPIRNRIHEDVNELLYQYLQYVTLATAADIVPLVGENRTLVKLGLECMNRNPLPCIRALIETAGFQLGKISTGQIVFGLAPRINAVGRIGDATRAVDLLTSTSYEQACEIARVMESENTQRRKIDEETFLHAQELVETLLNTDNDCAIVLHEASWHPGVIGIVASRLVERYYRPTILMTTVDGVAKGSARSISGFNIHEALKRCEDKILQFGGHKYAAGLTVEIEKLDEFREAFQQVAQELLSDSLKTPVIHIDTEIFLTDITPKFVRVLAEFAPFGPENMRPIFAARNVELVGQPRIVGKNHLRFKVRSGNFVMDAIGFNLGDFLPRIQNRERIDIAFSLDESEYAGELVPQLKIRDIK